MPGEIHEFSQLEQEGWLGQLMRADSPAALAGARPDPRNLASPAADLAQDVEQYTLWTERLEALFERMGDSLDEY